MEFRILGPIEVRHAGDEVLVGAGKQRALLAQFLLRPNEALSRDRLIHDLWGEHPPPTASKALQGYVSALRRLLAAGGDGCLIVTRGAGYELRLDEEQLDRTRFERLREIGRKALGAGEPEEAAARLREALALWRGAPLDDVAYEAFAQPEIARLQELRIATLEDRVEADLAAGRHTELVGELEALIARNPLRERPRRQLMLALYRAGRQADALAVYHHTRRALADDLGLEPSRELQELEVAILRHDPSLDLVAAAGTGTAIVGRGAELGIVLEAVDAARAGHGGLVLIAGEPGIGKSRLAEEVAQRGRRRGMVALVGRAWEAGGAPAYWPWVQAIRSYVRERDPATVREQLGSGAADVAQMLPELRELLPEIGPPVSLDPEGARFRLFDATATFLRRAGDAEPLVVVLDDIHAADAPSLLLLHFLAPQLAEMRVLVLGLYRPEGLDRAHPLTAALGELARHARPPILLGGLGEDDISRFIEESHGVVAPPEVTAMIHRETEGNPLFVVELARLLATEGTLETADVRIAMPASVRDAIRQRLHRLTDDCLQVLVLASVLGREFSLDALLRVSDREPDALLDLLDEAIGSHVVGEAPGGHGRLRFEHALVRDALYEELPATRRIRHHRAVGHALEGLYGRDVEPHLAELAHHFSLAIPAADAASAARYARRAGDRAAALLAYEEAARLYAMAIDTLTAHAAGDERDHCDLLLRLGDVQARHGDIPSAKESFVAAAEIARGAGLTEQLAEAALGYGGRFVWARAWGDPNVLSLLEEALAALPRDDSDLRVRLLARASAGPLRDTLPVDARAAMSQEALDMARRLGDPATLAYALNGRYCADWRAEKLPERLAIANELIAVAERLEDAERAYAGHDCRFASLLEAGDVEAAYHELTAITRLAHQMRQPAQLWDVSVDHAKLALFEGRFAEAQDAALDAFERTLPAPNANARVAFELQTYALRREQARLAEVVEAVERAVAEYAAYPVWRYVLGDVYVELDRTTDARAMLETLAGDGFAVDVEMQWLFSLSLIPELCRYLGDAERAAIAYVLLRPFGHLNASTPPELCRGSVSRGLGILAATMSDWEAADRHFETALAMNDAMGARPWLAHAHYDRARMLLDRGEPGDDARACLGLDAAGALCRELGMEALGARVGSAHPRSHPARG